MTGSIVAQLVRKDLYLLRWIVAGSILGGAVALAILPLGPVAGYVGGVSLICTLVILNIFLVMTSVVQEQKDRVLLFVLSLPISPMQYVAAKVLANTIAFGGTWLVVTAATIVVVDATALPNGLLPFLITVLGYLLSYHCVLLGVALATESTGWHVTAITVGNISVNFLIPYLLGLPAVIAHQNGPTAVWTADVVAILAGEIAFGAAALCLAIFLRSRRADLV
jgi:ABC-type transport system involved in multi-copper enzyme maturation permease subunit